MHIRKAKIYRPKQSGNLLVFQKINKNPKKKKKKKRFKKKFLRQKLYYVESGAKWRLLYGNDKNNQRNLKNVWIYERQKTEDWKAHQSSNETECI